MLRRTKTSPTSPWANRSIDPGGELVSSKTRWIPRQYGSATSCLGTRSRVPDFIAEALSPIGQSKTWTAHRSFPVACAYAAAHRWAARAVAESSSPTTMQLVIMIKAACHQMMLPNRVCHCAGC
jgi:hypothetical protein